MPPYSVRVAGGAISPFGIFPERSLGVLTAPVVTDALAQAGVRVDEIEMAFAGVLQGQETVLGQVLLKAVNIGGIPIHTVKNACSSGSDAVHLAYRAVAWGQADCVLALGAEKLSHENRGATFRALATATDRKPQANDRSVFLDVNAERARRYMERYGATAHHFARCAAKNRAHAALNPRAAVREPIDVDEVLADRVVLEPLTRSMCGGICDGAATVVLVSEEFARRKAVSGPSILASSVVTGRAGTDGTSATERAGHAAYEQAGLGPLDIDVAEVHDPASPQELFDIEDLGFAGRGGAVELLENGDTALGGRIPVNTSGGLTSRGHPVGATGVAQIVGIAEQLTVRAGARQVEGARIGLAQMAGGLLGEDSAVSTVHILAT